MIPLILTINGLIGLILVLTYLAIRRRWRRGS